MLEVWDGRGTRQGVALILAEQELRGLAEPWATAELDLTDGDFNKLRGWARFATGERLARQAGQLAREPLPHPATQYLVSPAASTGLLLLALCSEAVRRDGSTYAVWPAVAHHLADVPGAGALITDGGASQELRDALRSAASRFGLLGGDDFVNARVNRWYRLLLLQGGIPDADIPNLPRWLDQGSDATYVTGELVQSSPTFARAWEALGGYRRGVLTRDGARRELVRCPFFRSAATDSILDAIARAPIAASRVAEPLPFDVALALKWGE